MRTDFDPDVLGPGGFYKLLTAVVIPRPIAWVSTTSPDGVDNVAPHSFFTVASVRPPIVAFSSIGEKDTVRNVRATGEFVVNFTPEPLFEVINETSTDYPHAIGEFDACGVTREPSLKVGPPRVADSPAVLECRLHSVLPMGNCFVVFGEVVHAAVRSDVLVDGHPEARLLRPLARLGRDEWSTLGDINEIKRRPYEPAER